MSKKICLLNLKTSCKKNNLMLHELRIQSYIYHSSIKKLGYKLEFRMTALKKPRNQKPNDNVICRLS